MVFSADNVLSEWLQVQNCLTTIVQVMLTSYAGIIRIKSIQYNFRHVPTISTKQNFCNVQLIIIYYCKITNYEPIITKFGQWNNTYNTLYNVASCVILCSTINRTIIHSFQVLPIKFFVNFLLILRIKCYELLELDMVQGSIRANCTRVMWSLSQFEISKPSNLEVFRTKFGALYYATTQELLTLVGTWHVLLFDATIFFDHFEIANS